MDIQQPIANPFGLSVFGSSVVRVAPDIAVLHFSVSRVRPHPKEAFQVIREAAQQIQTYLTNAQIKDAGSSRVGLKEEYRYAKQGEQEFVGYRTNVEFRVIIYDLSRVEEILTGVVDAGANNIISVDFQTIRLKALRVDARRQAILAAREKALVYCEAAGVELGELIHIEDVNPDQLPKRFHGHVEVEIPVEDDGQATAFDPGSITVAGTVMVAYKIRVP